MDDSMFPSYVDELDEDEEWMEEIERLIPGRDSSIELNSNSYMINDIAVEFPYEAYQSQILMMTNMISALQKSENCLLESPTGTGKTAALLCGLLAWQKEAEKKGNSGHGWPWEIDEATLSAGCSCEFSQDLENYEIRQSSLPGKLRGTETVILQKYAYEQELQERENPVTTTDCSSGSSNEMSSPKKRRVLGRRLKETPEESRDQSELCRYCIRTYYKQSCVPTVYYATRTLSQVKQVAKELKSTSYSKGVKMTILASRNYTCLNLDVNPENVNDECLKMRKNYWRSKRSSININTDNNEPSTSTASLNTSRICERYAANNDRIYKTFSCAEDSLAWDIEDLNLYSRRQFGCSYYGTRILKEDAKIVFCTYNHLLHGSIRDALNIDLTNSVIVFDEAHNIEDTCREIATVKINQNYIISTIISELEKSLSPDNYKEIPLGISPILNSLLNFFRKLSLWFDNQSKKIVFDYQKTKSHYKEFTNDELGKELSTIGFTSTNMIKFNSDLDILSAVVKGKKQTDDTSMDTDQEEEISSKFTFSSSVIKYMTNLFWKFYYIFGEGKNQDFLEHYKAAFVKTIASSKINNNGVKEYTFDNEFHNICLNPAVTFKPLKTRAHSIIVTSGTLSPLESFESELDTPFPIKLSAPHVIKSSNVFSSVITQGPNGINLNYRSTRQQIVENQLELGRCILNICKNVPHGVLVFLPSYKWMGQLKHTWETSPTPENIPILNQIRKIKKVFFEERDKKMFPQMMKDYTETILSNGSGCVLFAIFRGKISEGVDFKDNQARAVVTVGIPYGYACDPSIAFKKKYNDAVNALGTTRRLLKGFVWYETQAFRALNQAFGRCVRHQNDWGSLVIIESRIAGNDRKLSNWVSEKLQVYSNFTDLESSLKQFIETHNENQSNADNNVENLPTEQASASSLGTPSVSTLTKDNSDVLTEIVNEIEPQISLGNQETQLADADTLFVENLDDNDQLQTPRSEVAQLLGSVQLHSPAVKRNLQF